jgi:hypothetical protein
MGTRAVVDIIDRNNKPYQFSIYRDAFPEEVVSNLLDHKDEMELDDVKRRLSLRDSNEPFPNYYFSISLVDSTIEIHHVDFSSKPCKRGDLIFSGTFAEAKRRFLWIM